MFFVPIVLNCPIIVTNRKMTINNDDKPLDGV